MSNLQEVLEFIKNSEKSDLKTIYNIDLWARNKTIDLLKKKKF